MKIGRKIIDGFEDFVIQEILPDGYEDITTIDNFIKIGKFLFHDYKRIRKNLQSFDWNILTGSERVSVAKYRATNEQNCKDFLGETFDYWMTDFDLKSQDCRKERFSLMKTILIKNVSLSDRYNVLGYLNTTPIENNYLKFGIEGIAAEDPIEGIIDFVEATGIYSTTGIAVMSLTMIGTIIKEEMIIQLSNIIKTGTI